MANLFTKILTSLFSNDEKSRTKADVSIENKIDNLFDFEIDEENRLKHGWDEVFYATFSDDLNKMLKVVDVKTTPLNRHFLLQTIVNQTYKLRKADKYRDMCLKYAEQHLNEFDEIIPILLSKGQPTRVSTFQHYSTILTEIEKFENAIKVCEIAISYGLKDGTKGCYLGRIERIKKKLIEDLNKKENQFRQPF